MRAMHDKLCMWRIAKHGKLCIYRKAKHAKLSSPRGSYADGKANRHIDIHETVLYDKRGEVNLRVCFLGIAPSFALDINLLHTPIKAKLRYKHSIHDNNTRYAVERSWY